VTGEGRRDLRKYTKKGALKKGHQQPKKGCGKDMMMVVLVVAGMLGLCLWGLF
jgi:hypothetical protein